MAAQHIAEVARALPDDGFRGRRSASHVEEAMDHAWPRNVLGLGARSLKDVDMATPPSRKGSNSAVGTEAAGSLASQPAEIGSAWD